MLGPFYIERPKDSHTFFLKVLGKIVKYYMDPLVFISYYYFMKEFKFQFFTPCCRNQKVL